MTGKKAWLDALMAAQKHYDADLYLYSGKIDDVGYGQIVSAIPGNKRHDRALLMLTTDGGQANAAYQIARLFQKVYGGRLTIYCPSRCKSAGTLIALGADRLIMDQFSELGPLDVQLFKQNEIAARKSGLLARSSFEALAEASFELYEHLMYFITAKSNGNISFKVASDIGSSMASQLMSGVYGQMNPEVVGSEKRDLEIAKEYGNRLVATSENATEETVNTLVYGYPSHDFVIDNEEASGLFNNIEFPHESLYRLVGFLSDYAYEEATPTFAGALGRIVQEEEANDDDLPGKAESESGADRPVDEGRRGNRAGNPEPPAERRAGGQAKTRNNEGGSEDSPRRDIRLLKDLK